MNPLAVKLEDTRYAVAEGAHEIDMVISRGLLLAGERARIHDEIAATKEICSPRTAHSASRGAHLKVILETGELETYDLVREASDIAIHAGLTEHDFIKTSTGKVQPAATMGVTLVMLEAIRDHYLRTGVRIGMKPAGGIRTAKQALHYLVMVKETLGDDWLTPALFRFGASTLTNDILMQIAKEKRGRYMASWDFAEA
jgi:deoxyribose-phosphate aldolase